MIKAQQQIFINFILIGTVCGIILALFGNFLPDKRVALNTVFTGYLISGFFLLFLYIASWLSVTTNVDKSLVDRVKQLLGSSMPPLIILGQIIYILIINTIYKENLMDGRVANEFHTYSYAFTFLIIMQIGLLMKLFSDMRTGNKSSVQYLIYVFGTLSFLILGIMQTILQYFSTDG